MEPIKPNFLIIGSAKCGTTALASILDSHPNCCMSRPKEVSFFQDTIDFQTNPNFRKGWNWYKRAFSHFNGESMVGEATPSYSDRSRSPNTARRIAEFNPRMKLIYMVRNPLERQISAWRMQYTFGKERSHPWRIEENWALKGFSYWMTKQQEVNQWDTTLYNWQLGSYLEHFSNDNILVSYLEDWKAKKEKEIFRIMSFLKLETGNWNYNQKENKNTAHDRKIQRGLTKKILNFRFSRFLITKIPQALRIKYRSRILHKSVIVPEPDIKTEIVKEFLSFVEDDSKELHKKFGKSQNYWKS